MDSNVDLTDYNKTVIFPPANFSLWPMTRVGAIMFDVLLLVLLIVLWIVSRHVYRIKEEEMEGRSHYVSYLTSALQAH